MQESTINKRELLNKLSKKSCYARFKICLIRFKWWINKSFDGEFNYR